MNAATPAAIRSFYVTALAGLRWVEVRRPTGRRFGAEADARWAGFHGDLTTADRLDLLLRDADAEWPGAFGVRTAFAEPGVAEDDAFGPAWPGLAPVDAEDVWGNGIVAPEPDAGGIPSWHFRHRAMWRRFPVRDVLTIFRAEPTWQDAAIRIAEASLTADAETRTKAVGA